MTVRKGISGGGSTARSRLLDTLSRGGFGTSCPEVMGSVPKPEHAAEMGQEAFWGRTAKTEKRRDYMKSNPYKNLPPLERKPDGTPYRMTPAQRKRANSLIRRAYCNCEGGNCIVLDDGDACACPQMISYTICCKWFRWAVLPMDKALEAEIYCGDMGKPGSALAQRKRPKQLQK